MSDPKPRKSFLSLLLFVAIVWCAWGFIAEHLFSEEINMVPYSGYSALVLDGKVDDIRLLEDGRTLRFSSADMVLETVIPVGMNESTFTTAMAKNIIIDSEPPPEGQGVLFTLFIVFAPILLLVWLFSKMRHGGSGGNGIFGFSKSKAKLIDPKENSVRLSDVISNIGEHTEATEVIDYLRDPQRYHRANATFPRGILLSGPPGVGKTLLAKAIAGEAGVPFFSVSGSDFVEMFVGVGAGRVRDMFAEAKKHPSAIIFIDEIDAIGKARGLGGTGSSNENEQTLNALLVEMDGFDDSSSVMILGATNRPDVLDPALLRPGRFDRIIHCSLPDVSAREDMILLHLKQVKPANDVDATKLAKGTTGFSGAELKKMVNEAAILTARSGRTEVSMEDLERAKDKVMMGAESPKKMSDKEKENTAYHEAGHAIVGFLSPEHDPLYKVSIIPRGRALGVTQFQPDEDVYSHSKRKLISIIKGLLGGRAAEEIINGPDGITTGASNDLERATFLCKNMITRWGFGDIGLLVVDTDAKSFVNFTSENTCDKIDSGVKKMLDDLYEEVKKLLNDNRTQLDQMSKLLQNNETIDLDDIKEIMSLDDIGIDADLENQEDVIESENTTEK